MTAAAPAGEIARLSVEIDDVTPRVARCIEVPVDIRLDDLHFVLQIAIGWQNGHPFEFRVGDRIWGLRDRDIEAERLPAEEATLADILAHGDTFKYDYVLGEDWEHTVTPARALERAGRRSLSAPRATPKAAARQPTSAGRPATRLICAASPIRRASITTTCWISTLPTSIRMSSMKRRYAITWRA